MKTVKLIPVAVVFVSLLCSANVSVQIAQMPDPLTVNNAVGRSTERERYFHLQSNLPRIRPSEILEDIQHKIKENPNITSSALAEFANELLPTKGIDFDIDLASIVEKKIAAKVTKPISNDGDAFPYVLFPLELVTNSGAKKKFEIVAPGESTCCCGYYYTPFPVTQVTKKRITIMVDGKPHVLRRTPDLPVVQEYILYENSKKPKKIRSWEVPHETHPYGISTDGKNLYIDVEIEGLLLEISHTGFFRFVVKDSVEIISKGEDLRKLPPPKVGEAIYKSGELGLMLYKSGNKEFVVEFPYPCT